MLLNIFLTLWGIPIQRTDVQQCNGYTLGTLTYRCHIGASYANKTAGMH